jgi:DNA-binding MurR/RpiR family transcriptional regulator
MDNKTEKELFGKSGCLIKIRSLYPALPKVHKRIADLVLDRPKKIIGLTITEFANKVDASEASIIMFCKKLKFNGYHDLKNVLSQEVFTSSSDIHEEINSDDKAPVITKKVINSSIQALRDTETILEIKSLEEAASIILEAKKVSIIGTGISGIIAKDAWMRFFRIGIDAIYYDAETTMRMGTSILSKEDAVFAISHSGSTLAVIDSLKNAGNIGVKSIGLTNYLNSSISKIVDVLLLTSSRETGIREEEMTSRIAQLAVIDSLFVTVSNLSYKTSSSNLKLTRKAVSSEKIRSKNISAASNHYTVVL